MRKATSSTIAAIVGGTLVGGARGDEIVEGVATIDSRTAGPGDLFVAIAGERVDGHDFLEAAREKGAALALVTEPNVTIPAIRVDSVQDALDALARHELAIARESANPPVVIALTGSSGKTSTKDLLASILGPIGETIAPVGSRNNELGLPLTVLELTESTRYLVLEMGARGRGHIAHLASIARPDIALVLNVGTAHMGEFGSVEAIQLAKSELVESLAPEGVAVLNADDPRVATMARLAPGQVRYFSTAAPTARSLDEAATAWATDIELNEAAMGRFTLHAGDKSAGVQLSLTGEHHVANAAAAASAAFAAGVGLEDVVAGLQAARPRSPGRMHVTEGKDGITLINDAYNANPDSMTTALKALAHLGRTRRTIAVLGEMLELGENSVHEHDRIGRLAVRLNVARLIVVGEGARAIHNGASLEGSFGGESLFVESPDEAYCVLEKLVEPSDVVLFKASNGARLGALGERLAHEWTTERTEA